MPKETCPESYVWTYNFISLTAIKTNYKLFTRYE